MPLVRILLLVDVTASMRRPELLWPRITGVCGVN